MPPTSATQVISTPQTDGKLNRYAGRRTSGAFRDHRRAGVRRVQRNHLRHHFKHEHSWYAFVWPYWDSWLGTDPDPRSIATSETARDLFGEARLAAAVVEGGGEKVLRGKS